jgi:chromosomal replication initiation ATPase DnaA
MENRLKYFGKVMKVVAELMEVSEQNILGKSRESDVVDARWMVICLMKEKGYTTKQIAPLMLRPIRTINHAVNSFSDRAKYSFNGLGNTMAMARQLLQE